MKELKGFLLWHSGIGGTSGTLGQRFNLGQRLHLWLRSDPWPGNSICHRVAKKKKRINSKVDLKKSLHKCLRCHQEMGCEDGGWGGAYLIGPDGPSDRHLGKAGLGLRS